MNEVIELRSLHHQAYCLMLLIQTKTQARVMVENKVGKNGGGGEGGYTLSICKVEENSGGYTFSFPSCVGNAAQKNNSC